MRVTATYAYQKHIQYIDVARRLNFRIKTKQKVLIFICPRQRLFAQRIEFSCELEFSHTRHDHHVLPRLSHTIAVIFDLYVMRLPLLDFLHRRYRRCRVHRRTIDA